MAFNNGFSGDHKSLQHIIKTLDYKTVLIPGITANADVMVTAAGESAFLYTRSASSVASGNVGDIVNYAAKGVKRIDVPMTSRFGIGAIIPYANYQTVDADVVGDKVIQEAIESANQHNKAGLAAILAAAEAKTYTNGASAYEALVEAIANFKQDNAKNGLRPTGVLVSPEFYAKLLLDERFIRITDAVIEGLVGKAAGLKVVETVDMDSGVDFVLVHANGVVAPVNVNTLVVTDATQAGYPGGTLIAGELGYGFKVITKDDDLTLDQTNGYLVAKYSEGA